jgi:hypothetical protein
MFQVVRKNVDECVPNGARPSEIATVVAVAPYPSPLAVEYAPIEAHRDPDGEAAHAARERRGGVGLDEQVDVIGLHRVVRDPKSVATGIANGHLELVPQPLATEAR